MGLDVSPEKSFQAFPPIFLQSCKTKSGMKSLSLRLPLQGGGLISGDYGKLYTYHIYGEFKYLMNPWQYEQGVCNNDNNDAHQFCELKQFVVMATN